MEEEAGKLKRKGDGGADAPQELVHAMAAARDADAADMAGKRLRMKRRGEEEAKDGGALDEPHVATASIVAPLAQAGLAAGQALRRRGLGDDKVELAIAAPLIAVPVDSKLKAKKGKSRAARGGAESASGAAEGAEDGAGRDESLADPPARPDDAAAAQSGLSAGDVSASAAMPPQPVGAAAAARRRWRREWVERPTAGGSVKLLAWSTGAVAAPRGAAPSLADCDSAP